MSPLQKVRWSDYLPGLTLLAIMLATIGLMKFEGRLWWCACGQVFLWTSDGWSQHTSQHLFDPYSFTHVLHGFLLWWILAIGCKRGGMWQLVLAVAAESAWEVFENSAFVIEHYRKTTAAVGYSGDTVANSLGDILSCGVGFLIARRLGWKVTALLFIATEMCLALSIRNSFVLELLMLSFPIDAVKQWQLGR